VLFVGRLAEHKGAREAVDAWRRSGVELPLVVAGTGPLREALAAAGAEVLGWLDPPALSRAYRRARAVIQPSRWQEPFGIAGLEALTFGVPVVAWDSGGVAEWHAGAGLVPWGDVDGLAGALRDAVVRRAPPPSGFEPDEAMARLDAVYRQVQPD
jgi:glycosyltransferase involved in cell wall biosynthesis